MLTNIKHHGLVRVMNKSILFALFVAFIAFASAFTLGRGETDVSSIDEQSETRNKEIVLASFEAWKAGTSRRAFGK